MAGKTVDPVTFEFQVESEAEREARTNTPAEPIFQPQPDEDFDASELDPAGESNNTVVVTPLETGVASPSTGDWAPPVVIGPERVYDAPQRVWLPLPDGADRDEVRLYYYHATGSDRGWYPAEKVEGWLVLDSYLYLDVDGISYLGFLVRHAAVVQLGVPAE
ncbi:MAG: hypothetical protein IIB38_07405 [Candidatus Hydrogenedentes bacterium]|nr:hypothetical protein [Candidatus Hydrogenedentota bacterium]